MKDAEAPLTPLEFNLLYFLASNPSMYDYLEQVAKERGDYKQTLCRRLKHLAVKRF